MYTVIYKHMYVDEELQDNDTYKKNASLIKFIFKRKKERERAYKQSDG